MNILVTGGAGFLGHHVVEHILRKTDWSVTVLDGLNYAASLMRLADIEAYQKEPDRVKFIWHDLRSPISSLVTTMAGNPDYILHLAAESHVDLSLKNSIPFVASNVLGTAYLLEWIKEFHPHTKTIVFSTDEVFGPAPVGIDFKEDASFRPSNPYAASKAGEEMIAFSFAHAFKLPILIARSMNIFGERQHPEKFVPKTIKSIVENGIVTLHGKNSADISSRCWIHARNVADALLFLLDKGVPGEMYHITGEEKTVLEIANIISRSIREKELSDPEIQYIDFHNARPGHDKRYALDGTKLKKLGWQPDRNIETSLNQVIAWTKLNPEWLFAG